MTRLVPKIFVTRFFQLITSRQFAEAERVLERIKQKMHPSERNRGYFQALFGMLLTQKNNNDRYTFLATLDLNSKKQLKSYRHEFLSHVENRLHAEYDRGFFDAWAEYMRVLPRLETPIQAANNTTAKPEEEKTIGEDTQIKQETRAKAQEETEATKPQRSLSDFAK